MQTLWQLNRASGSWSSSCTHLRREALTLALTRIPRCQGVFKDSNSRLSLRVTRRTLRSKLMQVRLLPVVRDLKVLKRSLASPSRKSLSRRPWSLLMLWSTLVDWMLLTRIKWASLGWKGLIRHHNSLFLKMHQLPRPPPSLSTWLSKRGWS